MSTQCECSSRSYWKIDIMEHYPCFKTYPPFSSRRTTTHSAANHKFRGLAPCGNDYDCDCKGDCNCDCDCNGNRLVIDHDHHNEKTVWEFIDYDTLIWVVLVGPYDGSNVTHVIHSTCTATLPPVLPGRCVRYEIRGHSQNNRHPNNRQRDKWSSDTKLSLGITPCRSLLVIVTQGTCDPSLPWTFFVRCFALTYCFDNRVNHETTNVDIDTIDRSWQYSEWKPTTEPTYHGLTQYP